MFDGQSEATETTQIAPPPGLRSQARELKPERTEGPKTDVLIKFRHGLGDAIQLTAVLRHLAHYHPDWDIDVAALPGKETAFAGLRRDSVRLGDETPDTSRYRHVFDLDWEECVTCYADCPSTKAERCLTEIFGLKPIAELCRYAMYPRDKAFAKARRYLEQVCQVNAGDNGRYPVVLIHYQGNTSAEYKDLSHATIRSVCEEVTNNGAVPVILDWDNRSPLPDGKRIFNPHVQLELWGGLGTGDAEVLAALTELSSLMIGIDSGPLHVAAATSTPTIGVWTKHHPLHYLCDADNVMHLVPSDHRPLLRGDADVGDRYFREHYRYRLYDNLDPALLEAVRDQLHDPGGGLVYTRNFWIRANNAEQDLVVVQDIAENDSYRIGQLPMPSPVVVDVGAHIGCFSQALHRRNPLARIIAVECCPENVAALKKNVAGFATVIQSAVTYEADVALLNAVFPDCVTTGGSRVIAREQLRQLAGDAAVGATPDDTATKSYWADFRPVMTLTLEQIIQQHGLDRIDVLKLDCEGSEFSILENSTSLDRVQRIIGEYHGQERFHELVRRKFADWKLRILKGGELGTFWLENPLEKGDGSHLPERPLGCFAQTIPAPFFHAPWIYLVTPQHTGTHFLRLLLELHPQISFWKCGRTVVDGLPLGKWHKRHADGEISFGELLRLGVRCEADLPEWTRQEIAKLGLTIPDKHVEFDLVQHHALRTTPWYPSLPTVVAIRDPLLAIISGLRRTGPEAAESIIAGFSFLAGKQDECFFFCVDRWASERQRALDLFAYLGLEPTQEIYDYLALWPAPNAADEHQDLIEDKATELAEARRLAIEEHAVHPIVASWAERLRRARLQPFFESLGYMELAWFE